ncbi:MAG: (d)CMP kinase [Candidatus Hydrogenedentes bacterium]|nr:(d)CMP kinase [Candidatus Hydrogenedentota bacterium]
MRDIVAIDGPAGAGKSTIARRVAEALGFAFLDTGAMYRAATWWAMHEGINLDDPAALEKATSEMDLDLQEDGGITRVCVKGHDVSDAIRTPEVTRNIHKLDRSPGVRALLVELQRATGSRGPTVAEGRDIGTVVFPKAKCKVYLDASIEERARRRAEEFTRKGLAVDIAEVRADIRTRDEKDMTRAVAPLRRADDAHVIDTTHMTPQEAVDAIVALARSAWSGR